MRLMQLNQWRKLSYFFKKSKSSMGFPGGTDGKKIYLQRGRPEFDPWVRKVPWRRGWLPTPVFLPGESQGQKSLAGYSPWGHKVMDTTERHTHTHTHLVISVTWVSPRLE